jgi:nicotinamide-nucleotide amidase
VSAAAGFASGGAGSAAAPVVAALLARAETVATAESLTGGLVGSMITDVPGASAVYRGGLITYATELKAVLAGVSEQTLAADGPVASSTAEQMAEGAARACAADWGLATTGVAGPDPQGGHPVGQVFVAVAARDRSARVRELALTGDRPTIRALAAAAALGLLLETLEATGESEAPGACRG